MILTEILDLDNVSKARRFVKRLDFDAFEANDEQILADFESDEQADE